VLTLKNDYIEKGYIVDDYYLIEEDFIKFIGYVPLSYNQNEEDRKKIKSPKLADLLLRIGSRIDISFSSYINNPNKEHNWRDYKKLEPKLKLSDYSVFSIHDKKDMKPFEDWQNINGNNILKKSDGLERTIDFWWNAYTNVKHNHNIEKANLNHVYYSLAAFFLLLCKFKQGNDYSIKLIQYNYLNIDANGRENILRGMWEIKNSIITKLFLKEM